MFQTVKTIFAFHMRVLTRVPWGENNDGQHHFGIRAAFRIFMPK